MDTASGAFEDYMDVKIFNSAGRMEIYSSTDKIVIDGTLYKGTDKVIKALKAAEQKGLVAYTLNNDKTLRSLDYPEAKAYGDMSARDALNHMVSLGGTTSKVKYRTSHNIFGGNIPCHDNTKMFIIPSFAAAEDDDYSISTPKEYCRDDGTFENIYGYAFQNSSLYADFIVYLVPDKTVTSLTTGDYELAYAIKSIRKQLNASGDVVRFITDTSGRVQKILSVYDRSSEVFNTALDVASATSINAAFCALNGKVYDRNEEIILVTKSGVDVGQSSYNYDDFNVLKCTTAKIVLVSKNASGNVTVKVEAQGKKIGIYNCAEHEFTIAEENKAGANPFDLFDSPDHIAALKAECDFGVVLYHGGKEHYRYPSPYLQKVCRKIADKGADLILCQHSHCVGCMEKYRDSVLVYGQGNFLFDLYQSEYWETSLLVKASFGDRLSVSFLPLAKRGNAVRLAEGEEAEQILSGFYERSHEILQKGWIAERYREFCLENQKPYLYALAGGESNLGVSQEDFCPQYDKDSLLRLVNYLSCEPHRELITASVNEMVKESRR